MGDAVSERVLIDDSAELEDCPAIVLLREETFADPVLGIISQIALGRPGKELSELLLCSSKVSTVELGVSVHVGEGDTAEPAGEAGVEEGGLNG